VNSEKSKGRRFYFGGLCLALRAGLASKGVEDLEMPTSEHVHAAEIHLRAAHAHEAAAASHSMNDHLRAHEQSRLAEERSREAHKLSVEAHDHFEKLAKERALPVK
jgi:hypothetical protein